jgi:nitrogen fixation/metabolism regulation signal transduction histidine kinase
VEVLKNLVSEFSRFARLPAAPHVPTDLNEIVEDVLQAHDRDRFHVAGLAQARAQQGARQVLLEGRHLAQRQPLPLDRDEEPVHALGGAPVPANC